MSIGCATFNFLFLGIVLLTAIIALLLLNSGILSQSQEGGFVVVTLPIKQEQSKRTDLVNHLDRNTHRGRLESISKAEDHCVISYAFHSLGKSSVSDLQEGLDELVGSSSYSIYFSQHRVT